MVEQAKIALDRHLIKKLLVLKCLKDSAFKEKLLKNPKEAIESEIQIRIPEGVQIQVVEDSETTVHVVLPTKSELDAGLLKDYEISDEDLKSLSGGQSWDDYIHAVNQEYVSKGKRPSSG